MTKSKHHRLIYNSSYQNVPVPKNEINRGGSDAIRFEGLALVAAIGAVALGAMGPGSAQAIQERTIRWGHLNNTDHPVSLGVQEIRRDRRGQERRQDKVREFPSIQLGSEMQQQSALRGGTQEMQSPATTSLVGIVKEFGLIDFPFIVGTAEQADALLDGPLGKALIAKLPEKGLVGLGYWDLGFRNVTNSKRPITKGEDLERHQDPRDPEPGLSRDLQGLQGQPGADELRGALQRAGDSTVDGQENPFSVILSNKFFEVQKYLSVTNHAYSTNIILISKKFWDKLSPAEQKMLQDAAIEARDYQRKVSRAAGRKPRSTSSRPRAWRSTRSRPPSWTACARSQADRRQVLRRLRPGHRQAVQQRARPRRTR